MNKASILPPATADEKNPHGDHRDRGVQAAAAIDLAACAAHFRSIALGFRDVRG